MLKKWAMSALLVSSLGTTALAQAAYSDPQYYDATCCDCGCGPRPARITLRHIEGKGVGYKRGYTTLEGFFPYVGESWVPFLDVRGHIFNNHHHHHHNHWAANGGLGLRYLGNRVWGINGYYDYRQTHHHHYHQGGAGLESLGQVWDFRINGYWPFGDTSHHTQTNQFAGFSGNSLYLRNRTEFAMRGANAEIGAHVNVIDCAPLYFAAGPYYWNGHSRHTWGGEGRIRMDYMEYLRLELSGSYDRIFRGIVQGQLSINIPLGSRRQIVDSCCDRAIALARRAVQPVDRSEIIVLDHKRSRSIAINPETNSPWVFWFVDNTSMGDDGTFEQPFPTLLQAQNASDPNEVIYVFPGDGTPTGMDTGIVLQNDQKLFGAGIDQSLATTRGTVTIPAQAATLPKIGGIATPAVTAADNNEISGLNIFTFANNPGISATNITNIFVHNNVLESSRTTISGIRFTTSSGLLQVLDNEFHITDAAFGVHIRSTNNDATYLIDDNLFLGVGNASTGIELGTMGNALSDFDLINITNNRFSELDNKAIGGFGFEGTGCLNIDRNQFYRSADAPGGTVLVRLQAGADLDVSITNNTFTLDPGSDSDVDVETQAPTAAVCVLLDGNVSDRVPVAYLLDNTAGGTFISDVGTNVGTVVEIGTTPGSCTGCP
jgi:hypothetical protein